MRKIKKINPAVVVVFLTSVLLLVRHGFEWLTLCAFAVSLVAIAYSLVAEVKDV